MLGLSMVPSPTKTSKGKRKNKKDSPIPEKLDFPTFKRKIEQSWTSRVSALLLSIVDVCYVHLGRYPKKETLKNFFRRYLFLSMVDELEDKFKFHSGYLVCSLLPGTTLPSGSLYQGEIPGVVLGGWVRRFFASDRYSSKKKIQFALALQNAKRGASAISVNKQAKSICDHHANMSGNGYHPEREVQAPFVDRTPEYLEEVKSALSDVIFKFYRKGDFVSEIPIWRMPSSGATFESLRKDGGHMFEQAFLMNEISFENRRRTPECYSELVGMNDKNSRGASVFGFLRNPYTGETKDVWSPNGCSVTELRNEMAAEVIKKTYNQAEYGKVLEPFKVRGITAGLGHLQHAGRLIQKPLHARLRSEKGPFRFIGKRHNNDDIKDVYVGSWLSSEERWISRGRKPLEFTFFVAGDYKNATDNMHPELPKRFVIELTILQSLGPFWKKVLELLLGSHRINYQKVAKSLLNDHQHELEFTPLVLEALKEISRAPLTQTWGQLMGSPVSFPVLCCVNCAMLLASVRIYLDKDIKLTFMLKKFRPLFNGDDISFLSNPDHYKIWERVCSAAGLSLSPGKNYVSKDFININSTTYWATFEEKKPGLFEVVDFEQLFVCNPGLIKGQAKVMGDTRLEGYSKTESLMPFCDQLKECQQAASDEEKERILKVFRYHLTGKLQGSNRPWSLPQHLGGLGLPFGDETIRPVHLLIAKHLIETNQDASDLSNSTDVSRYAKQHLRDLLREVAQDRCDQKLYTRSIEIPCISTNEQLVRQETFEMPSLETAFLNIGGRHLKGKPVSACQSRITRECVEWNYNKLLKKFKNIPYDELLDIEYVKSHVFYKGGLSEPWDFEYALDYESRVRPGSILL